MYHLNKLQELAFKENYELELQLTSRFVSIRFVTPSGEFREQGNVKEKINDVAKRIVARLEGKDIISKGKKLDSSSYDVKKDIFVMRRMQPSDKGYLPGFDVVYLEGKEGGDWVTRHTDNVYIILKEMGVPDANIRRQRNF